MKGPLLLVVALLASCCVALEQDPSNVALPARYPEQQAQPLAPRFVEGQAFDRAFEPSVAQNQQPQQANAAPVPAQEPAVPSFSQLMEEMPMASARPSSQDAAISALLEQQTSFPQPVQSAQQPVQQPVQQQAALEKPVMLEQNSFEDSRFAAASSEQVVAVRSAPSSYVAAGPAPSDNPLDAALSMIKEQILSRAKQIRDEKGWVRKVQSLMEEMSTKTKKVNDNIEVLRKDTLSLLRKKRQIENAKLQKKLEEQLNSAHNDLSALDGAINHVKSKEDDFMKNKAKVAKTISDLEMQLKLLQGKPEEVKPEEEKTDEDKAAEKEEVADKAKAALLAIEEETMAATRDLQ